MEVTTVASLKPIWAVVVVVVVVLTVVVVVVAAEGTEDLEAVILVLAFR